MARKIRGSDHNICTYLSFRSQTFFDIKFGLEQNFHQKKEKIRFDGQLSKPSLEERVKKRNPKGLWFGYRRLLRGAAVAESFLKK